VQEVTWTAPLDEDTEHATYDPGHVAVYFGPATRAAAVLQALRAPYRGRSTPVNAWSVVASLPSTCVWACSVSRVPRQAS
jgi:hypothetical protein